MDNYTRSADFDQYGVTPYGFRRKLYNEILANKLARAREVFGVNIDTSETSFLGLTLRNAAWEDAELWEHMEEVYYAPFVNTSEGTSLDHVGMYLTITRRPAIKSKGLLKITGRDGTLVPKGFKVGKDNLIFETVEDVMIVNGSADVGIESVGAGKIYNVDAGQINEILNPIAGVEEVINENPTENGLDVETDEEFRNRYRQSYARVGGSTVPAITAALLDTPGVVDAEVIENTMMVEINGIPPKAFECFVYGGEEDDIILAIYQNKAAGIQAYGETVIDVTDDNGEVHKIGYTRAEVVDIWVKLIITKDVDYKGDDTVKRSVVNYIGGFDENDIEYNGLDLGQNVAHSKLVSSIICPGGILDVQAQMSTDGTTWTDETIEIAKHTIARTRWDRIVIEYA